MFNAFSLYAYSFCEINFLKLLLIFMFIQYLRRFRKKIEQKLNNRILISLDHLITFVANISITEKLICLTNLNAPYFFSMATMVSYVK